MEEVGIRRAKNSLSQYVKRVKQGETLIITERGIPVARLVPVQALPPAGVYKIIDNGLASWKGGKPKGMDKPPSMRGGRTLAAMVTEDRR